MIEQITQRTMHGGGQKDHPPHGANGSMPQRRKATDRWTNLSAQSLSFSTDRIGRADSKTSNPASRTSSQAETITTPRLMRHPFPHQ